MTLSLGVVLFVLLVYSADVKSVLGSGWSCNTIRRFRDCSEIQEAIDGGSGVYTVQPDGLGDIRVYCDMVSEGGGWTVFQRRVDGSEDFYRDWSDYMKGFGNVSSEFWLGNIAINSLLSQGSYMLRIDMKTKTGDVYFAEYSSFRVGDVDTDFKLAVIGYHGDAGDMMKRHNGMKFSTYDDENGGMSDCAVKFKGGWWYAACHDANLNGQWNTTTYGQGIIWMELTTSYESLIFVEMKVRKFGTN